MSINVLPLNNLIVLNLESMNYLYITLSPVDLESSERDVVFVLADVQSSRDAKVYFYLSHTSKGAIVYVVRGLCHKGAIKEE